MKNETNLYNNYNKTIGHHHEHKINDQLQQNAENLIIKWMGQAEYMKRLLKKTRGKKHNNNKKKKKK